MIVIAAMLAAAPAIEEFAWLAGAWRTEERVAADGVLWAEEVWTEPAFHSMLGVGRSVGGLRTRSFDFMRIARDEQGVAFWGSPNGSPAVRFPLVSAGMNRVEFANLAHDYPQRIVYEQEGETLTATISMMDGSKRVRWAYRRR
ncbi:DUF6265 family protein [Sphingomonas sp.]|jgi:hypothetical protein|uniref:DUF6265 family protein n=1 Tax=Sphingomonas sp. TaxID=28214 RepID=UPI002DE26920|nr:DUF6265 family protein [Sphingomonas sp.]